MISNDANDQSVTSEAFDLVHTLIRYRLEAGNSAVIDSTALVARDRKSLVKFAKEFDVPAYLIVLDGDVEQAKAGQNGRERKVPDHAIERHFERLASMRAEHAKGSIVKEGFEEVIWLDRAAADAVDKINWVSHQAEKIDVIGDVHGCAKELLALVTELGYDMTNNWKHPDNRTIAFLGDFTDRGPSSLEVLRLVDDLVDSEVAIVATIGNHDWKLYRKVVLERGVSESGGMATTIEEIRQTGSAKETAALLRKLFDKTPAYSVLAGGKLVLAHGALKRSMLGRYGNRNRKDAVSSLAMFGETSGNTNENGFPERTYNWVDSWDQDETFVFGHDVVGLEPRVMGPNSNVIGLDTGCVFGGRLSCFRFPEREVVSVGAESKHAEHHALDGLASISMEISRQVI